MALTTKQFSELAVGDRFRRTRFAANTVIWTKCEPFTAYGYIKDQNAATYAEPKGPWHYEKIANEEIVEPC